MSIPLPHPLIPTEIDVHLAALNANMRFPTEPLTQEQIHTRVTICDEAFQWFVSHGLPLERNAEGVYYLWRYTH